MTKVVARLEDRKGPLAASYYNFNNTAQNFNGVPLRCLVFCG